MLCIRTAIITLLRAAVWGATSDDHNPDEFIAWCRAWDQTKTWET